MIRRFENIILAQDGRVACVTMNRPDRRNALSLEHMEELIACFEGIGRDETTGAVILRGNGPAFCSGHDLSEMVDREPGFYQHIFEVCTTLMRTIQSIPQPVIAQVHGIATAAGCQLVATCDLAVASEEASFATPGVRIGLFCSTPMVALSRAVGRKKAMEMLLTGEAVSAEEALAIGLVNKVVPASALEAATQALAQRITSASPFVIGLGKRAFYQQIDMPQHLAYSYTQQVMSLNAGDPDGQEGIGSFLDKRQPRWTQTSGPVDTSD